ncbi:MAG: hypothetical protein LBH04_08615 [Tannerellaceae bacterium]|nr:hypothetical protein [Tannerellaceae bacterium]
MFNAKELDEETELYYYGARYYNPREALWLGINSYGYCGNNPVKYIAPWGTI